jgi:NodT family efflux transporter outer membrane factor (OMF) lipoprotein
MKPKTIREPFRTIARARAARPLLPAMAAWALAACAAVGPDYVAPATDTAARFANAPSATGASGDPAPLSSWWTCFHDPALTRVVEQALASNGDIAIAAARVEQARAVAAIAGDRLLPQITAGAQAASQRQSLESPIGAIGRHLPGFERNVTIVDSGVGASWEADLFGALRREREAAHAEAEAAEADRIGVRIIVAADAADAYFRIRAAQRRIAVAQAQIAADTDLQALVALRLAEGIATRREAAEADARLAQVRATIAPLRTELGVQLNRLDLLMGVRPGTLSAQLATPTPEAIPAAPAGPHLTPADVLRRRPDVMAAERRLAAGNARIGAALSEYYPKISLSGLLGFESMNGAALTSATFQPQAVAGIRWRLFDFGRIDAEVAHASGRYAEALASYRQTMLRATEDVENALVASANLETERNDVLLEVRADIEARDTAEDAYRGGVSSILEVLEQDRQLLAARDHLEVADAGAARAAVARYRAMGGGW